MNELWLKIKSQIILDFSMQQGTRSKNALRIHLDIWISKHEHIWDEYVTFQKFKISPVSHEIFFNTRSQVISCGIHLSWDPIILAYYYSIPIESGKVAAK